MKHTNLKKAVNSVIFIALFSVILYGCNKKDATTETDKSKDNNTAVKTTDDNKNNVNNSDTNNSEMKDSRMKHDNMNNEHIMINLPSMQCGTCKKNIETAVKKLDGIESINVDRKEKVAHINFDNSKVDLTKIEAAITAAGYDANDRKADPKGYEALDDCCKLPKDRKNKD